VVELWGRTRVKATAATPRLYRRPRSIQRFGLVDRG